MIDTQSLIDVMLVGQITIMVREKLRRNGEG